MSARVGTSWCAYAAHVSVCGLTSVNVGVAYSMCVKTGDGALTYLQVAAFDRASSFVP